MNDTIENGATVMVNFRLSQENFNALKDAAASRLTTVASIVRGALVDAGYLKGEVVRHGTAIR